MEWLPYKEEMSDTLCDIVAEFVDKPPGLVRGIVLHLRRATERERLVQTLVCALGSLDVVEAADGVALVAGGHPTTCAIDPGVIRTAGEVGCMVSHVQAVQKALADGISHLVVFEDDCVPAPGFSLDRLRDYLRRVKTFAGEFGLKRFDEFVLLGTCGCYTWRSLAPGLKATNWFNGSHAYIMGRPMMLALVHSYLQFLVQGKTAPVDGLIPLLLQAERMHAFCPEGDTELFLQDRSLPSHVVSEGTELRKG